jgi:hypothetical protein
MKLRVATCMLSLAIVCAMLPGVAAVSREDNIEPLSSFDQALMSFGIDDKQDVPVSDGNALLVPEPKTIERCAYLRVAPPSREADDSMLVPPPTKADRNESLSELTADVVCHPVDPAPEHLDGQP